MLSGFEYRICCLRPNPMNAGDSLNFLCLSVLSCQKGITMESTSGSVTGIKSVKSCKGLKQPLALDNDLVLCCSSQGRDSNTEKSFFEEFSTYHEDWKQEGKRKAYRHSLCFSGIIAINRWHWRMNDDPIRGHALPNAGTDSSPEPHE